MENHNPPSTPAPKPPTIVIEGDKAIVTLSKAYTHTGQPSVVRMRASTAGDDIHASSSTKSGAYMERMAHLMARTIENVDDVLTKVEYGFLCSLLRRDFARLEEAQARLDYPLEEGEEADSQTATA